LSYFFANVKFLLFVDIPLTKYGSTPLNKLAISEDEPSPLLDPPFKEI
jgi:hypothetical protein